MPAWETRLALRKFSKGSRVHQGTEGKGLLVKHQRDVQLYSGSGAEEVVVWLTSSVTDESPLLAEGGQEARK